MLPFHSFFSGSSGSSLAHLLSVSWSPGGSIRALNSTLTWISMPSRRATLSSISWSWRIPAAQRRRKNTTQVRWALHHLNKHLPEACRETQKTTSSKEKWGDCHLYSLIWSIAPAQNFPWNFLAPRPLRSWMVKGQRCSTLFLEKASLFSSSTTLAPRKANSMAVRRPHGPAPMIIHWRRTERHRCYGWALFWVLKMKYQKHLPLIFSCFKFRFTSSHLTQVYNKQIIELLPMQAYLGVGTGTTLLILLLAGPLV